MVSRIDEASWNTTVDVHMSDYQDILVTRDERVMTITLNRPESRNALRRLLLEELADALDSAGDDDQIHCAVIYGGERVFAAGGGVVNSARRASMVITRTRLMGGGGT